MTFTDFLTTHKIKMTSVRIPRRTDGIIWGTNHWSFTFKRGRKQMSGQFSGGSAVTSISPDNVIQCLASDATYYDFEPEDDPKLVASCRRTARKLLKFLGADLYHQLINHCEEE